MDTHSIDPPLSDAEALRRLTEQVAGGGDVIVLTAGRSRALLNEAARRLAARRCRVLRVAGATPGGLRLSGLLAQVAGDSEPASQGLAPADPASPHDDALTRGLQALTVVDAACDQIVLLVSGAQALQRTALHCIQAAARTGPALRLVLASDFGMADLPGDDMSFLRTRLAAAPVLRLAAIELPEELPRHRPQPPDLPQRSTAPPPPQPARPAPRAAARTVPKPMPVGPVMPVGPAPAGPMLIAPETPRAPTLALRALAVCLAVGVGVLACLALGVIDPWAWLNQPKGPGELPSIAVELREPPPLPPAAEAPAPASPPAPVSAPLPPPGPTSPVQPPAPSRATIPAPSATSVPTPPMPAAPPEKPKPSASPRPADHTRDPVARPAARAHAPRRAVPPEDFDPDATQRAWEIPYAPEPPEADRRPIIGTYTVDEYGVRTFRYTQ